MTGPTTDELDDVFGEGIGTSPEARARESTRQFVRSIDQLAEDSEQARGRRLSAAEALEVFGWETLQEVAAEGAARLAASRSAVGDALRDRREQLGLDARQVARACSLPVEVVDAAEASMRLPLRDYERIGRELGLDERLLSLRPEPSGNDQVAVRLRTIGRERAYMSPTAVLSLAEAAWVGMVQVRLEDQLGLRVNPGIDQNPSYGTPTYPAFEWGYFLARQLRQHLGLGQHPITSLRELAEVRLGIPVIQSELGRYVAGATVQVGDRRAVVINLEGRNRHVFVRRATLAHELGHLLYDPARRLQDLRVDDFAELDRQAEQVRDPVEQRANAFAIELIAPQQAAVQAFDSEDDNPLGCVMDRFGISYTAARYQIWNGKQRSLSLDSLRSDNRPPSERWEAAERYTVDYHPLRCVRVSRAGRFSALVARAAEEGLVSWDTAAEWLESTADEVRSAASAIRGLYRL